MSAFRVHPDDELDIPVHDRNQKVPWYRPLVEVVWGFFLLYLVYFVTKHLLAIGF